MNHFLNITCQTLTLSHISYRAPELPVAVCSKILIKIVEGFVPTQGPRCPLVFVTGRSKTRLCFRAPWFITNKMFFLRCQQDHNGVKNTPAGTEFPSTTRLRLKRTWLPRDLSCHKTVEKLNLTVMWWCLYDFKINVFTPGRGRARGKRATSQVSVGGAHSVLPWGR